MELTNQTIKSACSYFKRELHNVYEESELVQVNQIAFDHFFGWSRADLVLNQDDIVTDNEWVIINDLINALKTRKPLAQIMGEWEFYGLSFEVTESTLIPRPETEELIQLIVDNNSSNRNYSVLDIGTGSGCIAITLKNELNNATLTAFDVSEEALKIAKKNAKNNQLSVEFKQVNILEWEKADLTNKYDVIVSNPPYIPEKEKVLMHQNVLDFEPGLALFVKNEEPLIFYSTIAEFAMKSLSENGQLYFEINENYGAETKQLLVDKGFKEVNLIKDMNDKDRIVSAILG